MSLAAWLAETSRKAALSRRVFKEVLCRATAVAEGDSSTPTFSALVVETAGVSLSRLRPDARISVEEAAAKATACALAAAGDARAVVEKRLRSLGYDVDAAKRYEAANEKSGVFARVGRFAADKFGEGMGELADGAFRIKRAASNALSSIHMPSVGKLSATVAFAAVMLASSAVSVSPSAAHGTSASEIFSSLGENAASMTRALSSFVHETGIRARALGSEFAERADKGAEKIAEIPEDFAEPFFDDDPTEFAHFALHPDSETIPSFDEASNTLRLDFADGSSWEGNAESPNDLKELRSRAAAAALQKHGLPDDGMLAGYMSKYVLPGKEAFSVGDVVERCVDNQVRWAESLGHAKRAARGIAMAEAVQREIAMYMETRNLNDIKEKSWEYAGLVMEYSGKTGVPPEMLAAQLCRESGGDERAISPTGAGAGLMQVNPKVHIGPNGTATKVFGIKTLEELLVPKQNMAIASYHMRSMICLAIQSITGEKVLIPSPKHLANRKIREAALLRYLGANTDKLRESKTAKDYINGNERTRESICKNAARHYAVHFGANKASGMKKVLGEALESMRMSRTAHNDIFY